MNDLSQHISTQIIGAEEVLWRGSLQGGANGTQGIAWRNNSGEHR